MRRFILFVLLAGLCAVELWGCGPSANMLAGKSLFKRSRPAADRMADNPLRERADAKRTRQEAGEDAFAGSEHGTAKLRREASQTELDKFDKETLDLIEEELANTPPEERAQFYKDVISLQPAMVRQIIQTRRIVRQVGQDAPSRFVSPQQMKSGNRSGIQLAAAEEYADDAPTLPPENSSPGVLGREPARDPGLGAADPWNRQTQSQRQPASGGWTNDPKRPPAPLPFNQIPAISGTGHSAGYVPEEADSANGNPSRRNDKGGVVFRNANTPPRIQPPPGGAQSPLTKPGQGVAIVPNAAGSHRSARVPTDYNPQSPPVPNYAQNGSDPFAAGRVPPVRTASSNPNQPLAGVSSSLGLGDSFGPPPNAAETAKPAKPGESFPKTDLTQMIAAQEAEVAAMRFADQTLPEQKTAYVQKHVYLRMLYLMAGQESRAVAAIPDISPADQEFWQQTFWAMSNYFDVNAMPESEYRATQTIAQLRTAIQKLQENARLELRNVAFCHKISSFGNFDRFPQDEFGPGQPVLVYAEVLNFKSKPTTVPQKPNETFYQTQLKSSIEIHRLGPSGELVERFDFEPTEDLCHNHRRDYFHSYEFTIPQRISLGPHVMTLTVEDQLNHKIATYRLNFMVK